MIKTVIPLFLIFIFSSCFANDICINPWRIGIRDKRPYQYFNSDRPEGFDIDLIKEISKILKCEIQFKELNLIEQFRGVDDNTNDIIIGVAKRGDREKSLHFLSPYLNTPSIVVFLKSNNYPKNFQFSQIKNMRIKIASLTGAQYSDEYTNLIKNENFLSKFEFSSNYETISQKLIDGKVDAAIFPDILVAKLNLKSKFEKDQVVVYTIVPNDFIYIAYSKKTFTLQQAQTIDSQLKKIFNNGNYIGILKKYFSDVEIKMLIQGMTEKLK